MFSVLVAPPVAAQVRADRPAEVVVSPPRFGSADEALVVTGEEITAPGVPAHYDALVVRDLHAEVLGLTWRLMERWTRFGRVGDSVRVGNIDENRIRLPAPGFLLTQTSRDAAAGVGYRAPALEALARWFSHRIDNEIMFVPFPGFGANVNLPPTERSGSEWSVRRRADPALDLRAVATVEEARFRSGTSGGVDLTWREVPLAARQRATLTADRRINARDSLHAGVSHVGSRIYDIDQRDTLDRRIPANTTGDLRLARRFDNIELAIAATNLGNRGYFSYAIVGAGGASNVCPERPRAVSVSASARFSRNQKGRCSAPSPSG
jgi:iron complex outermembrane receptor protein